MSIVTYNNRSIANISAIPGAAKSLTHIKTLTASADSTISFVNGSSDVVLDSTYPIYLFKFINIHSSGDSVTMKVNFRDGGSAYDAPKTSTFFRTSHRENDTETVFGYSGGGDLAQATGEQQISGGLGNGNDESGSGELFLFNPSSTTFVKHFSGSTQVVSATPQTEQSFFAGYCNTTSAIDGVQFSLHGSNTMDAGTIKLYGIKDS
jgi:hypothetical protein